MRILILLFAVLIASCSSIDPKNRAGKDLYLDKESYQALNSSYSNQKLEGSKSSLYSVFSKTQDQAQNEYEVQVNCIDHKSMVLYLKNDQSIVDSIILKGRYSDGYFKVRRQFKAYSIAGPIFWVLGVNRQYIGLSKEKDLVLMQSGGSGYLLLVAFPLFASDGGPHSDALFRRSETTSIY